MDVKKIAPLMHRLRDNPTFGILIVAVTLTLLRYFIANPFDLNVLLNEEASIYLHAAEKSFFELFMMPDSNYINFINKFCAIVVIRFFRAIDNFALIQNVFNWFVAALFSTVFLSKRFESIIPSFRIRLILIVYLFLLPIFDMHMVFSQGYYVVFALFFYLLLLGGSGHISAPETFFIVATAPFAVFSKPVFFVFGFAFLAIFLREAYMCVKGSRTPGTRLKLLVYLLILYAFQAWFTLSNHNYIAEYANTLDRSGGLLSLLLFLVKKSVIFLGYGLVCPLAHMCPRTIANVLCFTAGIAVIGAFVTNFIVTIRNRDIPRLSVLVLLSVSVMLFFYGAISVNFLYHRFFIQDIFGVQWSHRMVFPVILFALFNMIFFFQRLSRHCLKICFLFLCLLCVTSYVIPTWNSWRTGYAPSFTWTQTRPLLDEAYPFIPHAYGMQFYYMRGMTFVSGEIPLESVGRDKLVARGVPSGRKVKYFMLKQTPDVDAAALPECATLNVFANGVEYKATLVNPGMNSQFLFKFASFIPSEVFKEFKLFAPEVPLAGKTFSGHIVGF